jgi:hypothetical protein
LPLQAKHCCELLPRLFALFGLVAQRHLSLTHVHRLLLLVHRCCLPFDSLQAERLSQAVSTLYSTFNHSTAGGFFPASPSPALSLAAINSGSDMVTSAPQLISTLDHSFLDADSIYSRVSESTSVTVPSQLSEPLIPGQCPIWLRSWLCSWILLSIKVSLRVADTLSLKQLTPFRSNVQPTSNIHTPRNFEPYSFFEFNGIDAALTVDTLLEKYVDVVIRFFRHFLSFNCFFVFSAYLQMAWNRVILDTDLVVSSSVKFDRRPIFIQLRHPERPRYARFCRCLWSIEVWRSPSFSGSFDFSTLLGTHISFYIVQIFCSDFHPR